MNPLTGELIELVFDIDTDSLRNSDFPFGSANLFGGGIFVPVIPEPSAAVLVLTAILGALRPNRPAKPSANLAAS